PPHLPPRIPLTGQMILPRNNSLKSSCNLAEITSKPPQPPQKIRSGATGSFTQPQNYSRASSSSTMESAGTSKVSPPRMRNSMMPSLKERPKIAQNGMPSSSASLNLTPGETFGRSSKSTSTPALSSASTSLLP